MDNNSDQYYLSRALKQIEALFNRGASDNWTTYDFEKLSEAIFDRTQVRLSVTTLKRIWGKLKYDSAPTLTTLNTLAQFAGFIDWRDLKQNEDRPAEGPEVNRVTPPRPQRKSKRLGITLAGAMVLLAGVYFMFLAARHK